MQLVVASIGAVQDPPPLFQDIGCTDLSNRVIRLADANEVSRMLVDMAIGLLSAAKVADLPEGRQSRPVTQMLENCAAVTNIVRRAVSTYRISLDTDPKDKVMRHVAGNSGHIPSVDWVVRTRRGVPPYADEDRLPCPNCGLGTFVVVSDPLELEAVNKEREAVFQEECKAQQEGQLTLTGSRPGRGRGGRNGRGRGGQPPAKVRIKRRTAKQTQIPPVGACQGHATNCLLQGHYCFDLRCSQGTGYPIVDEFGDRKCGCEICGSTCNFCCLMPNMPEISACLRLQEIEESKKKDGSGSPGNGLLAELHRAAIDQTKSILANDPLTSANTSSRPFDETEYWDTLGNSYIRMSGGAFSNEQRRNARELTGPPTRVVNLADGTEFPVSSQRKDESRVWNNRLHGKGPRPSLGRNWIGQVPGSSGGGPPDVSSSSSVTGSSLGTGLSEPSRRGESSGGTSHL